MSARVAFLALISTTFATSIWASVAGRRTAITPWSQRNKETIQCYNVFKRLGRSLTKNYLTTLITRGLKVISLTFNPLVRDVILFHLLSILKINETLIRELLENCHEKSLRCQAGQVSTWLPTQTRFRLRLKNSDKEVESQWTLKLVNRTKWSWDLIDGASYLDAWYEA